MESNFVKILRYTKNNIVRNKWLSLATVLVSTIIFTTASLFIASSLLARKAVQVAETKAQVEIYFVEDASENDVLRVKSKLESLDETKEITYISQEMALEIFLGENPDESYGEELKGWLPASLEVQAQSLEDLQSLTDIIKDEEATNPYVDDVQYREDVVEQLKQISKGINIGGIGIIAIFSVITFALIIITISFNIMAHKSEIEIMHLVGSKDRDISMPFILEGVIYTTLGALFAASFIIIPWYSMMHFGQDTNMYFITQDIIKELDLKYLLFFNGGFTSIFYLTHIVVAALIGFIGGSIAVHKYLKVNKK